MRRGRRAGFTLTELILVVVPLLIVFGGMALVMEQSGRNAWLLADAQLESETDAQRVVDRISEDLRAMPASSVTCSPPTQMKPTTELSMGAPTSVTYAFTPDNGVYPNTGTLTRATPTTPPDAPPVLSARLFVFTCTPLDANKVTALQVTSRGRTINGRTVDRTLDTRVWVQIP